MESGRNKKCEFIFYFFTSRYILVKNYERVAIKVFANAKNLIFTFNVFLSADVEK
jgi:hypothetical protein